MTSVKEAKVTSSAVHPESLRLSRSASRCFLLVHVFAERCTTDWCELAKVTESDDVHTTKGNCCIFTASQRQTLVKLQEELRTIMLISSTTRNLTVFAVGVQR